MRLASSCVDLWSFGPLRVQMGCIQLFSGKCVHVPVLLYIPHLSKEISLVSLYVFLCVCIPEHFVNSNFKCVHDDTGRENLAIDTATRQTSFFNVFEIRNDILKIDFFRRSVDSDGAPSESTELLFRQCALRTSMYLHRVAAVPELVWSGRRLWVCIEWSPSLSWYRVVAAPDFV